jgi:hypothetical protein
VRLRPFALLVLVAVVATGCADAPTGPDVATGAPTPSHGTAPDDLLLRWGYEGGFTPPEFQLTNLPSFSLYGDGTIVRPGPQIEIYPGPALPSIEVLHVDEAGVGSILQAAFDADLDTVQDLTDMGTVGIADAAETVFTLRAGGIDRTVRVYALGDMGGRPPGMDGDEFGSRQRLLRLIDDLGSLETWLPAGSVGEPAAFVPAGARVFASRYRGEPDLPQQEIAWPLETSLRGIGEDAGAAFRCIAVTGAEWTEQVRPAAERANQLTPWTSDGRRYAISFRPLLPDEAGC